MKKLNDFKCFEIEKNKLFFITGGKPTTQHTGAGTVASAACASGCCAYESDDLYFDNGVQTGQNYYNVRDCDVEKKGIAIAF